MKSTDHFKEAIRAYLDRRAAEDALFAVAYAKTGKSIDGAVTYILNVVKRSGCNGFADDEIYSMAVHYYDEDKIDIGGPIDCKVVIDQRVELTEAEKAQAREDAVRQHKEELLAAMKKKTVKSAKEQGKEQPKVAQASLFD